MNFFFKAEHTWSRGSLNAGLGLRRHHGFPADRGSSSGRTKRLILGVDGNTKRCDVVGLHVLLPRTLIMVRDNVLANVIIRVDSQGHFLVVSAALPRVEDETKE